MLLQHKDSCVALYCSKQHIFPFFLVLDALFFFFEHSIPSVLPLLSACLMYQSFRWGVTGMVLSFRSEELSVFQLLRQV